MRHGSHGEHNGGRGEDETISFDTVFRMLSDENRRHVLQYFHGDDGNTASFDDLVRHVTAVNSSVRDPHRVTIALHHWVLPTLEEAGIIEYDIRSETVRYRGHPRLEDLLDSVDCLNANR